MSEILQKLLAVGVSDSDARIRFAVFDTLDERYDPLLCGTHVVPTLCMGLSDEDREVCNGTRVWRHTF